MITHFTVLGLTSALIFSIAATSPLTIFSETNESPNFDVAPGLTEHFVSFLNDTGFEAYGFNRTGMIGGSFGGKSDDDDKVRRQPVIFVHGNGDLAAGEDVND